MNQNNKEFSASERSTRDLFHIFSSTENLSDELKSFLSEAEEPDVTSYLKRLLAKYDKNVDDILEKTFISRSYAYQILSGTRNPTDDVVCLLALGIGFDIDETQTLLKYAKRAPLYPKYKRDAIIINCISNKTGVLECDRILRENGLKPLT